ncbi:hypothetical protein [Streptomyces sp. NPDC088812]|uniref:hypothetical protein n=1 Tax=Streptomyces sp. NPDC088812 TaxID=3365905 RepID=UPI0038227AAF
MVTNDAQDVRLEQAANANYFVYDRETGKLIGRVWQEPNDGWWATFYLGEGVTARSMSGGRFNGRDAAVTAVLFQSKDR